jgi:hypothetical protein
MMSDDLDGAFARVVGHGAGRVSALVHIDEAEVDENAAPAAEQLVLLASAPSRTVAVDLACRPPDAP